MNFIRKSFTKTFSHILKYFLAASFLTVLILSNVLYYTFERVELKKTFEINKRDLSFIIYNINYVNEAIRAFCISQFYNQENYNLISANKAKTEDIERTLDLLRNTTLGNVMVDSAVIYNNKIKKYFSNAKEKSGIQDTALMNLIEGQKMTPLLSPVPRVLPAEIYGSNREVFTYFMYDSVSREGIADGALIINVSTNWLFETLYRLKNKNANIYIINRDSEIIADASGRFKLFDTYKPDYLPNIFNSRENEKIFVHKIDGEKRIITYLSIPNTRWIIVNDEPYASVFGYLNEVKDSTIVLTLLFIFLSIILSVLIATIIYRPIKNALNYIKNGIDVNEASDNINDDIQYIQQVFKITSNKLTELEQFKRSAQDIIKNKLFKMMVLESDFSEKSVFEKYYADLPGMIDLSRELLMVNLYLKYDRNTGVFDYPKNKDYKEKLKSIICQKFGTNYRFEFVDINSQEVLVIIDVNSISSLMENEILFNIRAVQDYAQKEHNMVASAFVSRRFSGIKSLNGIYNEQKMLMREKVFYNQPCLLSSNDYGKNIINKDFKYPQDFETKIIEKLKSMNLEGVEDCFSKFVELISKNGFEVFMISMMKLTFSIDHVIKEINSKLIDVINVDLYDIYNKIIDKDSVEDIKEQYIRVFDNIISHRKLIKDKKHSFIIDTIIDYINQELYDRNLSLNKIASDFNMSPVYLGKIFKEYTDKSIYNYINELRLKKTEELLREKNCSIKKIIEKVGFESESTYYKLFKKYFGLTPNEYRSNITIKTLKTLDSN